jgi:putative beta-lysine N-acetyltransferase
MDKTYIKDIKPIPIKQRSSLGVVELVLGESQSVKAIGVVYGIEHEISGDGFRAVLFLDHYNQRIKIINYEGPNYDALILRIGWLAEVNGFDKIICMAAQNDWGEFLKHGYVLEAVLKYFNQGVDAFAMSKFRSQERLISNNLMNEIDLIEKIMFQLPSQGDSLQRQIPEGITLRMAITEDIPQLIALYQTVFESYPSPLVYQSYFETIFQKGTLFAVCARGDRVLAVASAELHPKLRNAELTDCATHIELRSLGLMSKILSFLEEELIRRNYVSSYSMARARSFGMNNVFFRLKYEFTGRMVNNCDIFGCYEDMNIWVKKLPQKEIQSTIPQNLLECPV